MGVLNLTTDGDKKYLNLLGSAVLVQYTTIKSCVMGKKRLTWIPKFSPPYLVRKINVLEKRACITYFHYDYNFISKKDFSDIQISNKGMHISDRFVSFRQKNVTIFEILRISFIVLYMIAKFPVEIKIIY